VTELGYNLGQGCYSSPSIYVSTNDIITQYLNLKMLSTLNDKNFASIML